MDVWKKISTLLLPVVKIGGRKYQREDGSEKEEPQLLSIKIVPSPSVTLTKSHAQISSPSQGQTEKEVNSSLNIFPLSTSIVCVLSRLLG